MKLAAGFSSSGVSAGIKATGLDLALVVASRPVAAAGVFTTSRAPAAPVVLSRERVANGSAQAVVLNSGCANAATGAVGAEHAKRMTAAVAAELAADAAEVLVCSTGLIGTNLPIARIESAVPALVGGLGADATDAATAILTTDSIAKFSEHRAAAHTTGIAKGAGMIRPDMATMLAVLTTDAAIPPTDLQTALGRAVEASFNALSIDGCMSTNDTVVAMASGEGPVLSVQEATAALTEVCIDLARQIAADGEGATRQVDIAVQGAPSEAAARTAGLAIADSALVRSSFAASDANWGRVIAALGASGIPVDSVGISYAGIQVAAAGQAVGADLAALRPLLSGDFTVAVDLGLGSAAASVFTCDLTPEYVIENMETS